MLTTCPHRVQGFLCMRHTRQLVALHPFSDSTVKKQRRPPPPPPGVTGQEIQATVKHTHTKTILFIHRQDYTADVCRKILARNQVTLI